LKVESWLTHEDVQSMPSLRNTTLSLSGKGKKMNDVWVQYKEWGKSEI
jgi:hypothetical protein